MINTVSVACTMRLDSPVGSCSDTAAIRLATSEP